MRCRANRSGTCKDKTMEGPGSISVTPAYTFSFKDLARQDYFYSTFPIAEVT